MSTDMVLFNDWIRQRREALGMTQTELAQSVSYSVDMIRRLERGERRPSRSLAEQLALALRIDERERGRFVKVALGELSVENLATPVPAQELLTPSTIPVQATQFVGREEELAQINDLLQKPDVRLLTLCGPGGMGKTRLAIAIAEAQRQSWGGEVYFTALAGLQAPDLLAAAIAHTLRISLHGQTDPQLRLLNELRDREVLLVLDNYEHLLPDIDLLNDLLQFTRSVRLLVTSRERLQLLGEWVFTLGGLRVPEDGHEVEKHSTSAVQLFLDSMRRIKVGFTPTEEELQAIIDICRLVEGMPLAIELAASWTRAMTCREIADEIARDMTVLTTSLRNIPERHRSIQAVFDYSWQLLSPEEQRVLRQIAIFRGGFSRNAAKEVAAASPATLLSLLDKSLLRHNPEGRYDLHELVRQYAESRLKGDPAEEQAARTRHTVYYAQFLQQQQRELARGSVGTGRGELYIEYENVRLAWHHALATRNFQALRQSIQPLLDFYSAQGWFHEGESVLRGSDETLGVRVTPGSQQTATDSSAVPGSTPPADREQVITQGQVLGAYGWLAMAVGQYEKGQKLLDRSLRLLRGIGVEAELLQPLYTLGMIDLFVGNYEQAATLLYESAATAERLGDKRSAGWSLNMLAIVLIARGALAEAETGLRRSLELLETSGEQRFIPLSLASLGLVTCLVGDLEAGQRIIEQSVDLNEKIRQPWAWGLSVGNLGMAALLAGDYPTAIAWYQQSLKIIQKVATPWITTRMLIGLAQAELLCKQYNASWQHALDALAKAQEASLRSHRLEALFVIAQLYLEEQNSAAAIEIIVPLCTHPSTTYLTRTQARQLLQQLQPDLLPTQVALEAAADDAALVRLAQKILTTAHALAA